MRNFFRIGKDYSYSDIDFYLTIDFVIKDDIFPVKIICSDTYQNSYNFVFFGVDFFGNRRYTLDTFVYGGSK